MPISPPSPSSLREALGVLEDLEWLDRAIGKATKKPALPSVLTSRGFIQAILREADKIKRQVRAVVNSKDVKDRLFASTNIDWRGASGQKRKEAIVATSNLVNGLPTRFAPGVRGILDTESGRVIDDTHQALGRKHKVIGVDPVFALKNEQAISTLTDSSSIFFAPEYEQQATRFRARAQDTMAQGLRDGLGSREIGSALRKEFNDTAIHPSYWDTVAAVHVNRARSFSAAASYASNGVLQYEVLAVEDERTTQICRMMNGQVFSVELALDNFDRLEEARSLEDVKQDISPFMRVVGDQIKLGRETAGVIQNGTPVRAMGATELNGGGIHMPPYHFRCRTTVIPVLDSAPPVPKPVPGATPLPPPKPGRKPKKPKDKKPDLFAPVKAGPDPVAAAKTRSKKVAAVMKQVRDGRGFVPGQMLDRDDLFGIGQRENNLRDFTGKLSGELRKVGRDVIASDPKLAKAWNGMLAGPGGLAGMKNQAKAAKELRRVAKDLGVNSIPEAERGSRKKAFQDEAVRRAQRGKKESVGGGRYKFVPAKNPDLSPKMEKDLRKFAGETFDNWGPVAEQAMKRTPDVFRMGPKVRVHNSDFGFKGYFGYTDRESYHHEFGHSVENHVIEPRGSKDRRTPVTSANASYWRDRVGAKHSGSAVQMPGYRAGEISKEDKWATPYMGKVYSQGSTEVVSSFSELFGGNEHTLRRQLRKDPEAAEEFLGYMLSVIRGENTRQARDSGITGF